MPTIKLPGLVDPHVHLRDPGATHKEDWDSGTAAALAGGYTAVLDMPNNSPPIVNAETLAAKRDAAAAKARCDFGIYFGATADNADAAAACASGTVGLKFYLDATFGPLRLEGVAPAMAHARTWPANRPLLFHAEGRAVALAILLGQLWDKCVHICHVSRREEVALIRRAKERGLKVTCEVTPHHLFLSQSDARGIGPGRSEVRPSLANESDRLGLWENLDVFDCVATDHAPHTLAEKDSQEPPPGFPGLETALGLLLTAAGEGKLPLDWIVSRMADNPRRIFGLPPQIETWIDVDPEAEWTVAAHNLRTRCGWTPFEGWKLRGRVRSVTLRGMTAFDGETVLARPGSGRDLFPGG